MILVKLFKNKNKRIAEAYGKFYARPVVTQTVDLTGLSDHLANHNTGFSPGATKGLLTDMVKCIKELVLQGIAVKIDDLAIFSLGIRTKKGADSEKDFSVAKNIEGVKLRARATGSLTSNKLDLLASIKNVNTLLNDSDEDGTDKDNPDGGGSTPSGGGTTPTNPSGKDDSGKGDSGSTDDKGGTSDSGGSQGGGSQGSGSEEGDGSKEFE